MKTALKTIIKALLSLIIAFVAGTILMMSVCLIPTDGIRANVDASAHIFQEEGRYPWVISWCTSRLDNMTDELILNETAETMAEGESVLHKALTIAYTPRYWHGYLVIMKPLMAFMNYGTWRIVNFVAVCLVTIAVLFLLWKKGMKIYMLPYLLAIGMLSPTVIGQSIQYSNMFYIFSFSMIAFLILKEKMRNDSFARWFFFYVGIAVGFFDYLTYPLASFGMVAILYLFMKEDNWKTALKRFLGILIAWGIGYVGMWAGKWIVCSILTEQNVLLDAWNQIVLRSSHTNTLESAGISLTEEMIPFNLPQWILDIFFTDHFTYLQAFCYNVGGFFFNPITLVSFVAVIVCWIVLGIRHRKSKYQAWKTVFPMFLVAILPFLWYAATVNHSVIHYFFTHKELVITAFAIMCAIAKMWSDSRCIKTGVD